MNYSYKHVTSLKILQCLSNDFRTPIWHANSTMIWLQPNSFPQTTLSLPPTFSPIMAEPPSFCLQQREGGREGWRASFIFILSFFCHSAKLLWAVVPVPNPTFPFGCPLPSLKYCLFQKHPLNAYGMEGYQSQVRERGQAGGNEVLPSSGMTEGSHSCSNEKHWFWNQT